MKRAMISAMVATMAGTGSMAMPQDDPTRSPSYRVVAAVLKTIESQQDGDLAIFQSGVREDGSWGLALISGITSQEDGVLLHQRYAGEPRRYFYPASTVKLYAAIAAYEQINALARMYPEANLSEQTPLRFHPLFDGDAVRETDPAREASTVLFGEPRISIEAHKIFVVSDNPAFNILYDFLGQRDLNQRVWSWGARSTMITHRLAIARTEDQNRRSPRIDLGLAQDAPQIGERFSSLPHPGPDRLLMPDETMRLGTGYLHAGRIIPEPFDFSTKNFTTLSDLQITLARLLFPTLHSFSVTTGDGLRFGPLPGRPLDLTDAQRAQLIASATILPRESDSPRYDPEKYPDDHVKFLLPGLLRVRPLEEWRIVNKIGLAYGFVTENAYVEHRPTGRAVFVAAVIHRNPNGIYNDNQYDYETTLSEMAALGEAVARALIAE